MGQNLSNLTSAVGNAISSPTKTESPPPLPPEPTIPPYVVPENKVLPNGVGDVDKARKLLRPVSQELAKSHPDFVDIFNQDPKMNSAAGRQDPSNKENVMSGPSKISNQLNDSHVNYKPDPFSHTASIPNGNATNLNNTLDNEMAGRSKDTNLKRTHSLDRGSSVTNQGVPVLKRQASLTNINGKKQPAIPEDPREHLYNVTRHQPFSNLIPGITSLPKQNSFDSDVTMNLTYAQFAEHRRQKRNSISDTDTQKKLKDLGTEISSASTVPKSPFDRTNFGARSGTSSVSTSSSDNGVSKSKKKRAPPPPVGAVSSEPPVDYDMDEAAAQQAFLRRNSSASGNLRAPAPDPSDKNKRLSIPALSTSEQSHMADYSHRQMTGSSVPPPPPPAPPLPSTQQQQQKPEVAAMTNTSAIALKTGQPGCRDSLVDAKAQLEVLKAMLKAGKLKNATNNSNNNTVTPVSDNANTNGLREGKELNSDEKQQSAGEIEEGSMAEKVSTENKDSPKFKRMSSLLQHDIILAAQAQTAKQKKPKQQSTPPRPKDREQIFREELQKAALAREERRKDVVDNKEDPSHSSYPLAAEKLTNGMGRKGDSADVDEIDGAAGIERMPPPVAAKPTSRNPVDLEPSSAGLEEENMARVYGSSWTPADDLEPDDDIIKDGDINPRSLIERDSFERPMMVPAKMNDWKDEDRKKKSKKERKKSAADMKENNKYGSLRRFRNSVREGVRSVFVPKSKKGSKNKDPLNHSQPSPSLTSMRHPDLDASDNWELTRDGKSSSMRRSRSEDLLQTPQINGNDESESDDSDDSVGDMDFAGGLDQANENGDVLHAANGDDHSPVRQMKRAGVAYVNHTGQIIVLPEYNTVSVDADGNEVSDKEEDDNRAPKIVKKKKKKTYESTLRVQERSRREELIAQEIKEKENNIERERQRQQEIELNFRRLRDLETQDAFQRMQTNSILEQISLMQQQQITQAHRQLGSSTLHTQTLIQPTPHLMNGGPVVPTNPTGYMALSQPYGAQIPGYTPAPNLADFFLNQRPTMSTNINTSQYTAHSAPIIGNPAMTPALPNLSNQDLATLTEYMRQRGVPPPSTPQQWSYLLNSVGFNGATITGLNPAAAAATTTTTNNNNNVAPDLSSLLGVNKTLESTVASSRPTTYSAAVNQQAPPPNPSSNVLFSATPNASRLVELDNDSGDDSAQNGNATINSVGAESKPEINTTNATENSSESRNGDVIVNKSKDTPNGVPCAPRTENEPSKASPDSPEDRIDHLTSANGPATQDFSTEPKDDNSAVPSKDTTSPPIRLPPKVYGPIGFRPVPFRAGAS